MAIAPEAVAEALLRIPETGLDAFEAWLVDAKRQDERVLDAFSNYLFDHRDTFESISRMLHHDPVVMSMKTSRGKKIGHLIAQYSLSNELLEDAVNAMPDILKERESDPLGFTIALRLARTGNGEALRTLSENHPDILKDKDGLGMGLAFYASGHGCPQILHILQTSGEDIFAPVNGIDILQSACLKYTQMETPARRQVEAVDDIARVYEEKFGRAYLENLARTQPKIYLPLLITLPPDEVIAIVKKEALPCNTAKGSNAASHLAYFAANIGFSPSTEHRELMARLLGPELGEKKAKPDGLFGEHSRLNISQNRSKQDWLAESLQLFQKNGLSGEDLQAEWYVRELIHRTDKANKEAPPPGMAKAPSSQLSAGLVGVLLSLGGDPVAQVNGVSLADLAIAGKRRDVSEIIKTHIDARLAPGTANEAAARIVLEREQAKLSAFLGTGAAKG